MYCVTNQSLKNFRSLLQTCSTLCFDAMLFKYIWIDFNFRRTFLKASHFHCQSRTDHYNYFSFAGALYCININFLVNN